jgi:microsomal dipeptidase-like Zn-dependent dipeptidase
VITQELRNRGHSDADIAAILGGNAIRVLSEVLPAQ